MAARLESLEHAFFDLVSGRPSNGSLRSSRAPDEQDVTRLVRGDSHSSARERIEVYANMYYLRLRDSLAEDFPRVRSVVGDHAFDDLIADFLTAQPPRDAFLARLGSGLPPFIKEHRLGRETPWLGDLATLEWTRAAVFDAADSPTLTLETLRELPPEAFGDLPIELVPASRLIETDYTVADTWRDPEDGTWVEPTQKRSTLIVWRHVFDVRHEVLAPSQQELVRLMTDGSTFGELCANAATVRKPEAAAQFVWETLGPLVASGLVRAAPSL